LSTTSDLTVLLTVYRRPHLRRQLDAVLGQSINPSRVVVFQNENHQRLPKLYLKRTGVDWVANRRNTGYFGRFAYLLNAETKYVAVLDDDIIPGPRCLENYLDQAERLQAIIGGNGRIARTNNEAKSLNQPADTGVRLESTLVDFVGHMWLFEKRFLYDMFSVSPFTTETGEDMHLCFSSKLRSGTKSFVARQPSLEESCDITENKLSSDAHASFRSTPKPLRESVETYFRKMGMNFISRDEQLLFSS